MSNRQIIKQDYKLINARYKLSATEIKIIMNAISELKQDDSNFFTYEISVKKISNELSSQKNYTRIKKFCEDLMRKPLTIPEADGNFLVVNWFSSLRYINNRGVIQYKISEDLKPYLLDLKQRFVKYNLKYILPMTSSYSIRIYQFLKEYEKLSKRTFTVDELREVLQVPKSYKYADFKRKILTVASSELLKHSDLYFEYDEIKQGRKVTEILFRIKANIFLEPVSSPPGADKYLGKIIYYNGFDQGIHEIIEKTNKRITLVLVDAYNDANLVEMSVKQLDSLLESKKRYLSN